MARNPLYVSVYEVEKHLGTLSSTQIVPTVDPITGVATPVFPNLTIDKDEILRVIKARCDYIDSLIGKKVVTPISAPVPGIINYICLYLVTIDLFKDVTGDPADARENAHRAEKQLVDIQTGKLIIDGLSVINDKLTVVQPFESEARGSYNADYNGGSGLAAHMGLYDRGRRNVYG